MGEEEGNVPHHQVQKAFADMYGCIIHYNILVYGARIEEFHRDLTAVLKRIKGEGVKRYEWEQREKDKRRSNQ